MHQALAMKLVMQHNSIGALILFLPTAWYFGGEVWVH